MLPRIVLKSDVLWTCLGHALSTEHQEIMGLLLGGLSVSDKDNAETVVSVDRAVVLSRKDRKKDRVEVSYDHLAMASTVAEALSRVDGSEIRVVGWYHSHPHITVLPSHVDVKTQGQYQALGDFVGLIFSVFDKGRMEICAFQSRQNSLGEWERVEIPITVSDNTLVGSCMRQECFPLFEHRRRLESITAMQVVLLDEEKDAFESSVCPPDAIRCQSSPSDFDILRQSAVYKGAMYRLLDVQLYPTLNALRGKAESLRKEKELLLTQLDKRGDSLPNDTRMVVDPPIYNAGEASEKAMEALLMMVPRWRRAFKALEAAFDGFSGVVVHSNEPTQFVSGMAVKLHVSKSPVGGDASVSPWLLVMDTTSAPLLAVRASAEEGCVEFNIANDVSKKRVIIVVKLENGNLPSESTPAVVDVHESSSLSLLLGEHLHMALRLHLLTPPGYSDSSSIDLSLTQR